ncbi:MAG: recombination mediator RecR [bacterium]
MNYPEKLLNLIESFETLPTIGKKSAERLAIHIFSELSDESRNRFALALKEINNLKLCPNCHGISDSDDLCTICIDPTRDTDIVLVVENIKDVFVFERMNTFNGLYHVLNGTINFANNVGVDDLNINSLVKKVKENNIKEIILATNASTTGEVTAKYIKNLLENQSCVITRLAYGIPVGADISYTDEVTLKKAMEGRNSL